MRKALLTAASLTAMLAATTMASAQNAPPGATEQDRGIREEAGKPPVKGPAVPREQGKARPSPSVGQGQPGPKGEPEPPGGRYQDEKNNEEVGKPPTGGK
jgi:hypothetical protein